MAGEAQIHDIGARAEISGVEVDGDLAEHDRRREIDGGGGAVFHDRRTDEPRRIERDGDAIRLCSGQQGQALTARECDGAGHQSARLVKNSPFADGAFLRGHAELCPCRAAALLAAARAVDGCGVPHVAGFAGRLARGEGLGIGGGEAAAGEVGERAAEGCGYLGNRRLGFRHLFLWLFFMRASCAI